MNFRIVSYYLSILSLACAALAIPPMLWAVYFAEWPALIAFLESAGAALLLAVPLMGWGFRAKPTMFQREALLLVGVGWMLVTALGALPFLFSGLLAPVDAFFESMSGFTTTGATVIVDIEATPKSILFWRSLTHWLGGVGIVLIFLAVFPYLGAGGRQLFRSESSRPDSSGHTPRIGTTVRLLYRVYLGLTAVQIVLLMLAGMDLFDAMCHTFSTLSSGGFSPKQGSIGHYDSVVIESIVILFMLLAGTNFGLLFALYAGNWKALYEDSEWRVYAGILAVATLFIACNLVGMQGYIAFTEAAVETTESPSFWHALRVASFTSVSIMTTTGFGTEDFDNWPYASKAVLLILMMIGGCAGSTAGGLKVLRCLLLFKMIYWRIEGTFRPKTKRVVRISGEVVNEAIQSNIYAFFSLHLLVLALATLLLTLVGLPLESALSGATATLNCIGPAMQHLGMSEDYHLVPAAGKIVMIACMLLGRLELFTICALFMPGFWRRG